MHKRIVVTVVLAVLLAASACAQTTDFFQLACYGTPQQVQAAINKGADIKARAKESTAALMYAAITNQNPEVIATLLKAGAPAKAKSNDGKKAFDYAQGNEKLKGTDAFKQLEEASK